MYVYMRRQKKNIWREGERPKVNVLELKHTWRQKRTALWLGGVTAADELYLRVMFFTML